MKEKDLAWAQEVLRNCEISDEYAMLASFAGDMVAAKRILISHLVINLTPHAIRIRLEDREYDPEPIGSDIVIEPSGRVARCSVKQSRTGHILGIPVFSTEFGEVEGLPDPEDGKFFIVSALVGQKVKRSDCFGPKTDASAVRDASGNVFAVRGLQQF